MGLEQAHHRARDIIGEKIKCLEVTQEVERLRLAWKLERVGIVVLAEFDVWTCREETLSRVPAGREKNGLCPLRVLSRLRRASTGRAGS